MADQLGIIWDTAEVVLVAAGPFHGLALEDRITAQDIIAMAQGEQLDLNAPRTSTESLLSLLETGKINFQV